MRTRAPVVVDAAAPASAQARVWFVGPDRPRVADVRRVAAWLPTSVASAAAWGCGPSGSQPSVCQPSGGRPDRARPDQEYRRAAAGACGSRPTTVGSRRYPGCAGGVDDPRRAEDVESCALDQRHAASRQTGEADHRRRTLAAWSADQQNANHQNADQQNADQQNAASRSGGNVAPPWGRSLRLRAALQPLGLVM